MMSLEVKGTLDGAQEMLDKVCIVLVEFFDLSPIRLHDQLPPMSTMATLY